MQENRGASTLQWISCVLTAGIDVTEVAVTSMLISKLRLQTEQSRLSFLLYYIVFCQWQLLVGLSAVKPTTAQSDLIVTTYSHIF